MATDERAAPAGIKARVSWLLAIVIACLLTACGGSSTKSSTSANTASYQTLVSAGIKLLSQGNTSAAKQLFQQAVATNPNDPVADYNLGVIYQSAGDRRDALRHYNQALRADSRYVPALFNEATLVAQREPQLAMFYYRQVIRLQAHSATAYLDLGMLESETKGLHRNAVRDLTRAVALDRSLRRRIPPSLRSDLGRPVVVPRKSRAHH